MDFVTEKVEPQMTVIARRYRSARGKKTLSLVVSVMVCVLAAGCGRDEDRQHVPREQFVQIYADMLFLAELHRQDTTGYRRAMDSLCRVHRTDTASLAAAFRVFNSDPDGMAQFYDAVIRRMERKAKR